MIRLFAAAAAALSVLAFAAPAEARLSLTRAEALCQEAANARDPAPARVRTRLEGSTRETVRVQLNMYDAEGNRTRGSCIVNRDTEEVTITLD